MSFIFKIIGLMLALDIFWWCVLARATNRKWVRAFVTIFMIAQTIGLIWLISGRLFQTGWDRWLPKSATAAIFIWHFVGLGLLSPPRCPDSRPATRPRRNHHRARERHARGTLH